MAWTDEKKEKVVAEYSEIMKNNYETDEERANATTEIVAQLAEVHGEAPNGVRTILNRAGVYIKKVATAKAASKEGASKRVNKAEAHQTLKTLISAIDPDLVDAEIVEKLTGKAALYFAGILQAVPAE